jgi:hypothetical protein
VKATVVVIGVALVALAPTKQSVERVSTAGASARHERKENAKRPSCSPLGHPYWGTHKKMNGRDQQELREFIRLKHHSHGLKNQHLG